MSVFKDILIDQSRDLDEILSIANKIESDIIDLKTKCQNYQTRWFQTDKNRVFKFSDESGTFKEYSTGEV